MKRHGLSLLSVVCTCVLLCSFYLIAAESATPVASNTVSMPPPQPNKAKICSVNINVIKPAETKEYLLDISKVPEAYQNEIKFYTVNAMNYVEFKAVEKSDLVLKIELIDSHMNIVSANPRKERKSVQYKITAVEKENIIWTVTSSCNGRASEVSNFWFPGLVAAFLPHFGQPHHGMVGIAKYPIYLNAVTTPPAK